jgi:hypothetical protein
MHADSGLDGLRRSLGALPAGRVSWDHLAEIEDRLVAAWGGLVGSREERTTANKLRGRIEDLVWQPPELSFTIARHGGTVHGSTREALHRWTVNVDAGTASLESTRGFRQVGARAPALKVEPLVDEIVAAVDAHQEHPALEWRSPNRVRVYPKRIGGIDEGFQQTASGRVKRLVAVLEPRLAALGWNRCPVQNRYEYEHP